MKKYADWKKENTTLPDHRMPRLDPDWKEKFLERRVEPIIHVECGARVQSKATEGTCICGLPIRLLVESRGRNQRPRMRYYTKSIAHYCPHCLKMTSFVFLQFTRLELMKYAAWQCGCGTIYICPADNLSLPAGRNVHGDITLVGTSWKPSDLDPWVEKRRKK